MRWKREKRAILPFETYEVELRRDQLSGVVVFERWSQGGTVHREQAPAVIHRDVRTGTILDEKWYRNGNLHREDGPAEILRKPDGHVYYSAWFKNGEKVPSPRSVSGRKRPSGKGHGPGDVPSP